MTEQIPNPIHGVEFSCLNGKVIKIRVTDPEYLVWFGEKTRPRIVGIGTLVEVTVRTEEGTTTRRFVQELVKIKIPKDLELPENAIVYGGTSPRAVRITNIAKVSREALRDDKVLYMMEKIMPGEYIILAEGSGLTTWSVIYSEELETREIDRFMGVLVNPPYKYYVELKKDEELSNCVVEKIGGP